MEVSRSLLDGRISEKTAGLMFYGLQLAMVNAKQTTFKDTNPLEMVRTAPPVCRELKARKKMEARLAPDMEGKEDFAARALPEGLEAETDVEEADEAANPGVESAKSIFFGVEQCGGGVAEAGPSTSLRISPADSDAGTSAQVESAKSIFSGVEADRGGAATQAGPSTSLRISPADSDAGSELYVEEKKAAVYKPVGKPGVMLVHSGG
jgi:hypothetical protein